MLSSGSAKRISNLYVGGGAESEQLRGVVSGLPGRPARTSMSSAFTLMAMRRSMASSAVARRMR